MARLLQPYCSGRPYNWRWSTFILRRRNPYDFRALLNNSPTNVTGNGPLTVNSAYGLPNRYQVSRTIRLQAKFTF